MSKMFKNPLKNNTKLLKLFFKFRVVELCEYLELSESNVILLLNNDKKIATIEQAIAFLYMLRVERNVILTLEEFYGLVDMTEKLKNWLDNHEFIKEAEYRKKYTIKSKPE